MSRVLLTVCLIVSLTACPFRCMGMSLLAAEAGPATSYCCDHCRDLHDSSNTDDNLPEPGEQDSGCCVCVCTGAVLLDGDAVDQAEADVNVLATAALATDVLTSPEFFSTVAVHPPPLSQPSGSALRFALQSLLI